MVGLTASRFLFGVGEAGAFPTATRAMQLWYPREERGLAQGVSHSASRLGGAIAPPLVVAIMIHFGWREVFYICGGIGLLWSILWYFSYRNLPEGHAWASRAEIEYIRGTDEKGNVKQIDIRRNRLCLGGFCSGLQICGQSCSATLPMGIVCGSF